MFTTAATPGVPGPSRWYAPETILSLKKESSKPPIASKPADIFAFAMLAMEVFTGEVPFENMKNNSVDAQIVGGKRPDKPLAAEQLGLTEEMWKYIEKCWSPKPDKRPNIDEVVRAWEGFVSEHGHISGSGTSGRQSTESSTPFTNEPGKPSLTCNPRTNG